MTTIRLPNHWRPRDYQLPLWTYLEDGGLRAVEIAHRRWGKDDVALNRAACAAHERVGNYWHMLPQANQARKAIWEAVNPHTGKRRVDEAFPDALRSNARDTDMMMRFKSGSTWQVVGSDNFDSLVGSSPVGIVFSEWALADPRAWGILRPILDENKGWALFITTPRGRNHALRTLELARAQPDWFGEVSSALDTAVFTPGQLEQIKFEMQMEHGDEDGEALFDQEYGCSFDAPLIGAYYAKWIAKAEQEGRIRDDIPHEPGIAVQTAWDLGRSDDTAIWFYQVVANEIRVLDYYASNGENVDHYCEVLDEKAEERGWTYGLISQANHWVPWDAVPKTMASRGRSIVEQAWDCGIHMKIVPNLGVLDGIAAARMTLPRCWFDKTRCHDGLEALRSYQREWDDDKKCFKKHPLHNWASHPADAFRYLSLVWREPPPPPEEVPPMTDMTNVTINRLWRDHDRRMKRRRR